MPPGSVSRAISVVWLWGPGDFLNKSSLSWLLHQGHAGAPESLFSTKPWTAPRTRLRLRGPTQLSDPGLSWLRTEGAWREARGGEGAESGSWGSGLGSVLGRRLVD